MSRRTGVKNINAGVVNQHRNVSPVLDTQLHNYQASRFANTAGNFTARIVAAPATQSQKKSLLFQDGASG